MPTPNVNENPDRNGKVSDQLQLRGSNLPASLPDNSTHWLEQLCDEVAVNRDSMNQLFDVARPRLLRLIRVRMSATLNVRSSAEDIVQETFLVAAKKLDDFLSNRRVPVIVWLRGLALERLIEAIRANSAKKRDMRREVSVGSFLKSSNLALTREWTADVKSPSEIVSDKQRSEDLKASLGMLSERYREVLVLRFFEGLNIAETASAMNVKDSHAKVLQFRAIRKLKSILAEQIGWNSADCQSSRKK
ncbi:MAG: sigma-70 family RNA polymerase sigma factor [Planctomycetota bacterium]